MRSIRLVLAACFIGIAGLLGGCLTEIEEFLTDKPQAKEDARLLGVWIWAERDETIVVHIQRMADKPNLMQLTYVDLKPGTPRPVDDWRRYTVWPTRLGAIDYLNLELIDGESTEIGKRIIVRYEIDPKTPARATFWLMSDDAVRAAIRRGDLAGREANKQTVDPYGVVTANRGALRDYLRANAGAIFPEKGTVLTRAVVPAE